MHGRNRPRIAQAELVELPHLVHFVRRVHLVDRKHDGLVRLAEDSCNLLVVGVDARFAVDEEHDQIGFAGGERLGADRALERVVGSHFDAAGVDEREVHAVPIGFMVGSVAGHAAHLVHDGLVGLGYAVHEGGFAHVGPSHHCHYR